ncbi:2-dehydropantoate 2-reductase [Hahella sp. NBU794]|uniref:2-dehydropantoate 2-reductase n=1 Tax=Hahella sp. NBU794 TaxID=3422590 RepID=UPI003D6EF87E
MRYAVLGAGTIGSFLGGMLQAGGNPVWFVGRSAQAQLIAQEGLHLRNLKGGRRYFDGSQLHFGDDPAVLANADCILVTVKSQDTASAAEVLRRHAPESAIIVSFQNGVRNAGQLKARLPHKIIPGMVPFNVIQPHPGDLRQVSSGHLAIQASPFSEQIQKDFKAGGLPLDIHERMEPVQWSKLLLNLNNAINALSGLPLRAMLLNPGYRKALAAAQREALRVIEQAGFQTVRLGAIVPELSPYLLHLPTPLFRLIANAALAIDPDAGSSMQDDLRLGKKTEVEYINGEVTHLADKLGAPCPVNRTLMDLIKQAEAEGRDYRKLSAQDILNAITTACAAEE